MTATAIEDPRATRRVWLEGRQRRSPDDLVVAHDLGLCHYWQARKLGRGPEALEHWQGVIANWAVVLDSDDYWQSWAAERAGVYGKEIRDEQVTKVRQELHDRLARELVEGSDGDACLDALFALELRAIRLLVRAPALSLPYPTGVRLIGGPLLARRLELGPQVGGLFAGAEDREREGSLRRILAVLPDQPKTDEGRRHELRIAFSQLGSVRTLLERGESQRALGRLATLRCPACGNGEGEGVPGRCHDACPSFARLNPSYGSAPAGRGLYHRHAVELGAGAHLALAYRELIEPPAVSTVVVGHLEAAVRVAQAIGVGPALRKEADRLLLAWAGGLEHKQRFDEAIALLDAAAHFGGEGRAVKLASVLNLRGVQHANEKRWEEAVADLRRACELNPGPPLFRDNLSQALQGFAAAALDAGNHDLAVELQDELVHLAERREPVRKSAEEAPAPAEESAEGTAPAAKFLLDESQRANPHVFDERGHLRSEVFDPGGREVLERAWEETIAAGETLVRLPALLSALARQADGETGRLLARQGIPPARLWLPAPAAEAGAPRLLVPRRPLSQFDLWLSVLKTLDLTWEIAQYDRGRIGEPHLLYGLLANPSAGGLLEAAGVNVEQMIEQAGWND